MDIEKDYDFWTLADKGSPKPAVTDAPISKLSVVSLFFGILGMKALPLVGSMIAIVTGHGSLGEIRDSKGWLGGRQMARGGCGSAMFSSRSRSWPGALRFSCSSTWARDNSSG